MLRVLGSSRQLCTGLKRRDFLEVGGSSLAGLSLAHLLQADGTRGQLQASVGSGDGFGRAKRCIILFLYGSPSQLETVDMKPEAPLEVRGTIQPIPSVLPGLDVCEYWPNIAKMTDRITVVRSMCHQYPIHGVAYAMTGTPIIDVNMELALTEPVPPRRPPTFSCRVSA